MNNIEIIPAILPETFDEIVERVSIVKGKTKTIQIDICDGRFVPNATWPYADRDETFERFVNQEQGLPAWDAVDYEFDLMINFTKPEDVEKWVQIGAVRIVIHAESRGNIGEIIEQVAGRVELGLALNIDTDISVIKPFIKDTQFIQLMGIEKVGFQGQVFDERVIQKVIDTHKMYPDMQISVDGGVSLENAPQLIKAGATRLVVGSAIFESDDILASLKQFQSLE